MLTCIYILKPLKSIKIINNNICENLFAISSDTALAYLNEQKRASYLYVLYYNCLCNFSLD